MKLDYLMPYTKLIKYLNVRPEKIKYMEKTSTERMVLGLREAFVTENSNTKGRKSKINEWDYIKLKSFCTAKETANKTKRQPTEQDKIFANNTSTKG